LKPIFQIAIATVLAPIVAAAVMAVICAPWIAHYALDAWAGYKFEQIRKGDSETAVISRMGTPDSTLRCGDDLWWGESIYLGKNDGRCVTESSYNYFLSRWVVGYSRDGRVVSKSHFASE
jgi:hypothetical protein